MRLSEKVGERIRNQTDKYRRQSIRMFQIILNRQFLNRSLAHITDKFNPFTPNMDDLAIGNILTKDELGHPDLLFLLSPKYRLLESACRLK